MELVATSTQRTYRAVRVAIVGAAVALGVAVVVVTLTEGPVTSISALYYTSGRTVFTGALFAIALGLLALSGHSVERVLLDVAAVAALVIAIVPTPVDAADAPGAPACAVPGVCVPTGELTGVRTGVTALALLTAAGIVTALVLAAVSHRLTSGVVVAAVGAAVIAGGVTVWLTASPRSLLAGGHLAATGVFFGLVVAVVVVSAVVARGRWRLIYAVIGALMGVGVLFFLGVFVARLAGATAGRVPLVLVGETVLVSLFAVFWIVQTVHTWHEIDPALMAPREADRQVAE